MDRGRDSIHLTNSPGEPAQETAFETLPEPVLDALRDIRRVRDDHIHKLSAVDRRKLAAAEHLIARHIDLQAQIDAHHMITEG